LSKSGQSLFYLDNSELWVERIAIAGI
jgi:hypothetical protein